MKAFLMYKDRDFDLRHRLSWNEHALSQDLELKTLFDAMALGDKFLFQVSKSAVLSGLNNDLDMIRYRQNILMDCLKNSSIVRDIYAIVVGAIEGEKRTYWGFITRPPAAILHRAIEVLQMFVTMLKGLKNLADEHADKFESEGFRAFFAMLNKELEDEYFARVESHLTELKFRGGVLISAKLGKGNSGTDYVPRKSHEKKQSWMERIFAEKPPVYTFYLHPRDENGARALSELNNRGSTLWPMRSRSPLIIFSVFLACCGLSWPFTSEV
jgi:hypothetical protein